VDEQQPGMMRQLRHDHAVAAMELALRPAM